MRRRAKYRGFDPPPGTAKKGGRRSRRSGYYIPPSPAQRDFLASAPPAQRETWAAPPDNGMSPASQTAQAAREDLPPLEDWPPAEIKARWAAQRERQRRNREIRRTALAGFVAVAVIVAGIVALTRLRGGGHAKPAGPPSPSEVLAWSVNLGLQRVVTVVAVSKDRPPVAVAIPNATLVDIPGGPGTVGLASTTPGLTVAAVQAALGRRVDHYLVSDSSSVMGLVNDMGGVTVQAESAFTFQGQQLGPGQVRLRGGAVLAYLDGAAEEDLAGRWEEVLSGLFSGRARRDLWDGVYGESDAVGAARSLLERARGAIVLELPTSPTPEGEVQVDPKGLNDLLLHNFGPESQKLVRVVLLNGTGRSDLAGSVSAILAPKGYQVVAMQPASEKSVRSTQVVAAGDAFLPQAQQVQGLLGVGTVYVGPQPTGIADITIVMGKDLQAD